MKIGILLPAYNEEKNITLVIKDIRKHIKNCKIVVVDDGSSDKTAELAKKARVIVILHSKNKGKGEALKTGFKYFLEYHPEIKYIIVADADRQYPAKELKKFLDVINDADIIMGYRNWSTIPFRHKLGNFVWRFSFNLLFGTNFKDTNCGLIALKRDAIKKMKIYGRYIVENSLLASAVRHNLKVKQVKVSVHYKDISGVSRGVKIVFHVLIFIIKEGIKYRLGFK